MSQYKFVAVEGRDGKPSKLTKSIRSHAIRTGLQKATYPSRAKAAVQSLGPPKFREGPMFRFELHGGMTTLRDHARPNSIVSAESTISEYRNANAQSVPKISAEVELYLNLFVYRYPS